LSVVLLVCREHAGHARQPPSFPTRRSSDLEANLDERWLPLARKLTIERNTAELLVEDAEGLARRYTVYADGRVLRRGGAQRTAADRKSTRLNSSHVKISYAVFCLKKKKEGS